MKINFETPPARATDLGGLSVEYTQAKRQPPRWRWRLVLLLLALVPLFFLGRFVLGHFWQQVPGMVVMEGSVIRSGVTGHVTYMAPQGSQLARGDVLAKVERVIVMPPQPEAAASASAGASAAAAARRVTDPQEAALRDALAIAHSQAGQLQQRVTLMRRLRTQGAATVQEVQSAEMQVLQAQSQAARVRVELAQLQEARLREARQSQSVSSPPAPGMPEQVKQEEIVRMPFTGIVSSRQATEGEWVDANSNIASLLSTDDPVIHAYLEPRELDRATPGQPATLVFQDGGRVAAKVLGVAAEAERQPTESSSPLMARNLSVVVRLQPLEALPERYRVSRMPLEVRFERPQSWAWLNRVVAQR